MHAYTMNQALQDGMITPLQQKRVPDLDVNERAIDTWFERITANLTAEQSADLKRKYTKRQEIYQAHDRIHLIALDIAHHLDQNLPESLKAQLACDSKTAAIAYKKYFDDLGLFESAIVMSAPDTQKATQACVNLNAMRCSNGGNMSAPCLKKNIPIRWSSVLIKTKIWNCWLWWTSFSLVLMNLKTPFCISTNHLKRII